MIGLGLHAVPNVFHRVKIVAWGILLRRAGLELRIFINKRRIRRLERRMLAFQRLRLIADKCKDRFDVVEGALIRDEIIEIVELLGKTHGLGSSAKRAESGNGSYWTKCRKALSDVIAESGPKTDSGRPATGKSNRTQHPVGELIRILKPYNPEDRKRLLDTAGFMMGGE